ncbi:hypothetical protein [uncultured Gammaproteobacteria bacterium]|nr:hypothetical protein [uncultured Gammaproteobacteria bacterium]
MLNYTFLKTILWGLQGLSAFLDNHPIYLLIKIHLCNPLSHLFLMLHRNFDKKLVGQTNIFLIFWINNV